MAGAPARSAVAQALRGQLLPLRTTPCAAASCCSGDRHFLKRSGSACGRMCWATEVGMEQI
eukprot:4542436-Prymnesium_polylepis.1